MSEQSTPDRPPQEPAMQPGLGGDLTSPVVDMSNWQYVDGTLAPRLPFIYEHEKLATALVKQEGPSPDTPKVHFVAGAINRHRDSQLSLRAGDQARIDEFKAALATPGLHASTKPIIGANLESSESILESRGDYQGSSVESAILEEVTAEVADVERQGIMAAIDQRIESDRFPWTMPGSLLDKEVVDAVIRVHAGLTRFSEALPNDSYKVAQPMKKFEGTVLYAPEDELLLSRGGIDMHSHSGGNRFSRAELQQAGVFFVNRVGAGEQPIFGVPIPDSNSPNGYFDVQDRSFLTRGEFDTVYNYQQEHGYGLPPDADPADVQIDMIMFAAMPDARQPNMRKGYGFGGRENKYGMVRSPFVDLGFKVHDSVESTILGYGQRINTTTIHLANGHPDYPGVSEMFDPDTVEHDQSYISPGEFVRTFRMPLPSQQEVLKSMQYGLQTARERAWVGHSQPRPQ